MRTAAGRADDRIDSAECLGGGDDEGRGLSGFGEVAGICEAIGALGLDQGMGSGEVTRPAAADGDTRALLREAQGRGEANPSRSAGDGDDLARELQVHGVSASTEARRL